MFILAFFRFLRCSELTISSKFDPAINPTIADLTILDSETISFLVKQSKTDQIKKGHFVYIFNLPSGRRQEPPGQTTFPFKTCCSTRLTCPTRRSRNQSDVDKSLPDNNLTFSCSTRLTRPTRRSRNQSDVSESLPVSQTYLFHSAAGKSLPNHAASWLQGFPTT